MLLQAVFFDNKLKNEKITELARPASRIYIDCILYKGLLSTYIENKRRRDDRKIEKCSGKNVYFPENGITPDCFFGVSSQSSGCLSAVPLFDRKNYFRFSGSRLTEIDLQIVGFLVEIIIENVGLF